VDQGRRGHPGAYLAFEGNGRIAALQEVNLYHFQNPTEIRRRLQRVQWRNGLPSTLE